MFAVARRLLLAPHCGFSSPEIQHVRNMSETCRKWPLPGPPTPVHHRYPTPVHRHRRWLAGKGPLSPSLSASPLSIHKPAPLSRVSPTPATAAAIVRLCDCAPCPAAGPVTLRYARQRSGVQRCAGPCFAPIRTTVVRPPAVVVLGVGPLFLFPALWI